MANFRKCNIKHKRNIDKINKKEYNEITNFENKEVITLAKCGTKKGGKKGK